MSKITVTTDTITKTFVNFMDANGKTVKVPLEQVQEFLESASGLSLLTFENRLLDTVKSDLEELKTLRAEEHARKEVQKLREQFTKYPNDFTPISWPKPRKPYWDNFISYTSDQANDSPVNTSKVYT